MAAPLVVSFWMRAAVTFVDTLYASLLGDAAVAAVGLTIPIEFLMIAFWVGLSSGLTSRLSRAMGAARHAAVERYLAVAWRLVMLATPLFTAIGLALWFLAPELGLAPDVTREFQVYGTVLVAGSALTTFWSVIPDSLVKAHQDTRSTMWAGIWTNLINVGLNTLFLFGFGWGVFGIALSTALGRIGGLVYALGRARVHEQRRRAEAAGADPGSLPEHPYRNVLALAVPSSLTFALMATETGLINWLLATSRHATEAIAAYSIYYRVVLFALQPVIATGVALLPFAAHRSGAGDADGVRRGLREAAAANAGYALVLVGPIVWLIAGPLARMLGEAPLTVEYTAFALRAVPLACLVNVPFLLCRPVFEALGRGRPGLVMAALRYLLLTGPLAWLGTRAAAGSGWPVLYGLIAGTILAAGLTSATMWLWSSATLATTAQEAGPRTAAGIS